MVTTNEKAGPTVAASPARKETVPSLLTFKAIIVDVASWWCYAILKRGDLKLFDELDSILESLPPIPAGSPLSTRLRCLVPWQELLKQLYTPGCTVGKKTFDEIQDKFVLLQASFNSRTRSRTNKEYNDILRMLQTHSVLSKLYNYLAKGDEDEDEDDDDFDDEHTTTNTNTNTNTILDECDYQWRYIYLDIHQIPPSLLCLVNKNNGWDCEDRRDHIIQIVSFKDSALTYKRLKNKMQSLLLRWFEDEIDDGGMVPELLEKRYRGIGFGDNAQQTTHPAMAILDAAAAAAAAASNENTRHLDAAAEDDSNSIVMRFPIVQRQKSRVDQNKSTVKQQRVSSNNNNNNNNNNRKSSRSLESVLDFNSEDESESESPDFDPEKKVKRVKLQRERRKRFKIFSQQQQHQISTAQRLEELLSMQPVGELYDSSTRRTTTTTTPTTTSRGQKRRRQDRSYHINPRHVRAKRPTFSSSNSNSDSIDSEQNIRWTKEEDNALINGIERYGYGNWPPIFKSERLILNKKGQSEMRDRANTLMGQGII